VIRHLGSDVAARRDWHLFRGAENEHMKPNFLFFLWLLAFQLHAAQVITGEIVGINDGYTVKLLSADKQQIKIRLSDSDTPEKKQPHGSRASRCRHGSGGISSWPLTVVKQPPQVSDFWGLDRPFSAISSR
jgi:endonuclease YncB( thermonuclease family)